MSTAAVRKWLMVASAIAVLPMFSLPSVAGGFSIHEQSAEFQGSSFAGVAAGGAGLSSIFWNPAAVTLNEGGWKSDLNLSLVMPYGRARNELTPFPGVGTDSGNIGKTGLVPASYDSYRINEMLWVGLAVNAPFGMKTENDPRSIGALFGYKSKIVTYNINPVLGIRLNDMISLGLGLQVNYMKGDLTNYNPALSLQFARVKGDDWGVGFTVGALLTPFAGTRIGIGYRSRIKHTLKGTYYNLPAVPPTAARVRHTLPDIATISLRQDITDDLRFLATVEWTNWSLFENFTIRYAGGSDTIRYDWKDGWLFAAGGEYDWSDSLTLRLGYAYEKSPVRDSTRGVRVPDNDRHWISVGVSWRPDDWLTLHAGYSHLFVKDGTVAAAPIMLATFKNHVNIVAVSATIDTSRLFSRLGGGD